MKRPSKSYFFLRRRDLVGYERIDGTGVLALSDVVGETLAHLLCDCENDLDLIRFRRIGSGETIIVRKSLNHITLLIELPYDKT